MERALEVFATIHFLIVGLSQVFQPRAWVEFFRTLRRVSHERAWELVVPGVAYVALEG